MHHDASIAGGIFGILVLLFFVVIGLLAFAFWIWMLIDAIQSPRLEGTEKIVWVLVILLLNWLGAVIYFLVGRRR